MEIEDVAKELKALADWMDHYVDNHLVKQAAYVAAVGRVKSLLAEVEKECKAETPPWFLLYGGSSADGAGPGVYEGRTTSVDEAWEHYKDVEASPYSTGKVNVATDKTLERLQWANDRKWFGDRVQELRK